MFSCCATDASASGTESITADGPSVPVAATGSTQTRRSAPRQEPRGDDPSVLGAYPAESSGADLNTILEDVDTAELMFYMQIFDAFGPEEGKVPMDFEPMRSFVQRCTSVGEDLDPIMGSLGVTPEAGITLEILLDIIRQHSISEVTLMEEFSKVTEQDSIPAEECRSALRSLCEQDLAARFSEGQWDQILTTVMLEVATEVPLEMWMAMARRCARITRLAQGQQ